MDGGYIALMDQNNILGFEDMRLLLAENGYDFLPTTLSMKIIRETQASPNVRRPGDLPRPFRRVSNGTCPLFDRVDVLEWVRFQNGGELL